MNPTSVLAVIFLLLAHLTPAHSETLVARGIGTRTCAEFTEHYKADAERFETLYFTWAQGFMSGMNLNADVKRNLGGELSIQKTTLRLFCADNPSKSFVNAVLFLY